MNKIKGATFVIMFAQISKNWQDIAKSTANRKALFRKKLRKEWKRKNNLFKKKMKVTVTSSMMRRRGGSWKKKYLTLKMMN